MASNQESTSESDTEEDVSFLLSVEDTDYLRKLVHQRLEDCGWRNSIRDMVRDILNERGVRNINYEDIAAEVIPRARDLVPEGLCKELQQLVRNMLEPSSLSEGT